VSEQKCQLCGATFTAAKPWARFCSPLCRLRSHRAKQGKTKRVQLEPGDVLVRQQTRHVQLSFGEALIVTREGEGEQTEKGESEMASRNARGWVVGDVAKGILTPDAGWFPVESAPCVAFVLVTPALARAWLPRFTEKNRPLSDAIVEMYGRDIANDDFLASVLWISDDGQGLDGQHRLSAIANGNTALLCIVSWGHPIELRAKLDKQRKRTVAHELAIREENNACLREAVVRTILRIAEPDRSVVFSASELLDGHEKHREAIDWACGICTKKSATLARRLTGDVRGILAVAWMKNKRAVDELVSSAWLGEGLTRGSAALTLMRYFQALQAVDTSGSKTRGSGSNDAKSSDGFAVRRDKLLQLCYSHVKTGGRVSRMDALSDEAKRYYLGNRKVLLP
jgi:hypothetical protein